MTTLPFYTRRYLTVACVRVPPRSSQVVAQPKRTPTKKAVNLLALSGILIRRVNSYGASTAISLSFVATAALWAWAVKRLALGE